jgi:hypothetical protein
MRCVIYADDVVAIDAASGDKPDMRRPATGPHTGTLHHRAALLKARVGNALGLLEALKDLNPDFLRKRSFDLPHAIPEPDDFPLFLDVHWRSLRRMTNENI